MSTKEQIIAAASKNASLLQTLSETDYSSSALQQNNNYIASLKKDILEEGKKLKTASAKVQKEYADHKKYRDSHMKRMAYRMGRKTEKFESQASKEEQEWLEAVQIELQTKKNLEQLNRNLADATRTNTELQSVNSVHVATQGELDALYNSIFQGPTPDIPEEDVKETEVKDVEGRFNALNLQFSNEQQALAILADASKFLDRAQQDLMQAESAATADLWGFGGTFSEMSEHSALSRAQSHVSQVEMLISQAQRIQPAVQNIGTMNVAQQNFLTDVLFDNVFSDYEMQKKVRQSCEQIAMAKAAMNAQLQAQQQRREAVRKEMDTIKANLDGKRRELQEVRGAAFQRLGAGYENAPPGYQT